ncbi:MAG: formate--tetrahydrofolate ligase [Rhodobiaceae bacterium]|jgi:formate--tetrahydrofolate ligase|nr:formate--tetrahydrofolate ligase [Rhodobiaceae bacterium]MDC3272508.1 formate--tetrahydrofolate ligase [Hyphomicrobiales bacterium]
MVVKTDIEIAREADIKPITEVASNIGIQSDMLSLYGKYKAKISEDFIKKIKDNKKGKLILVTAITPTPAGEGKTTTTVGLGDGLNKIGKKALICIREPSLGPCFGMKGGAAGGGKAQVIPMEDINLHFTGDFHAIGVAHNLLCAMVDNHIYWGNDLNIDSRRVVIRRVVDMNDRALREIVSSLGGVSNGFSRNDGFDITVASEVMAIFCLANDLEDLTERLGNIVVAYTRDKKPITARQLKANDAMAVLLKDAFMPNIVQTLENNPAFVHGGPFANIAHGCNSVIATDTALKMADYVVTEAGFGADLGAEKFFDIKCRSMGVQPSAVVIVATIRALKMHGGVTVNDLGAENVGAVERGCDNLIQHIDNMKKFGVEVVVSINKFTKDSDSELDIVSKRLKDFDCKVIVASHWSDGSEGIEVLAKEVVRICDEDTSNFNLLYDNDMLLVDKIKKITADIYRASEVFLSARVINQLKDWENLGYGHFPICMAKTQYSFSTDPKLKNAPIGHKIEIKDVRLSAGAGFIVAIAGDIMTMPGLPRKPAAESIKLDISGNIEGLF